jgi:hypothetical protein
MLADLHYSWLLRRALVYLKRICVALETIAHAYEVQMRRESTKRSPKVVSVFRASADDEFDEYSDSDGIR